MSTELKDQIRGELTKQKEEKLQKEKDLNKNLKEITFYAIKDEGNIMVKNFRKFFKDNEIRFQEKDILIHQEIRAIVQVPAQMVVVVNGIYLVHGRDFNNPQQLIGALRFVASPDYVIPSDSTEVVLQQLKNLSSNIGKQFQGLMRTLQPMLKVMNDLQKEMEEDNKETSKKGA
mgnify:CR=1 FL=1|tara:strand:+ start:1833 stop:2354 length:522 start_codon:yes stop_codon:yes gene_type:complete